MRADKPVRNAPSGSAVVARATMGPRAYCRRAHRSRASPQHLGREPARHVPNSIGAPHERSASMGRALTRLLIAVAAFAALLAWWSTIEPSNDRDWKPPVAVLPYATFDGSRITLHNIRDF